MFGKLGPAGVLGVLLVAGGVAVIALENLVVAGGIALVVAGLGFVVYGLIKGLISSMGMGGMV